MDDTGNSTVAEFLLLKRLNSAPLFCTQMLSSLTFCEICNRIGLIHGVQVFLSEWVWNSILTDS